MSTTAFTPQSIEDGVRTVSDAEVAFYREHGWVFLEGLISPELAARLLESIIDRMAHNENSREQGTRAYRAQNLRDGDEFVRSLATSRALAEAHAQLIGWRPLRLWSDSVHGKLKAGSEVPGTRWHQDYPSIPLDRAIGGGLWIAPAEITPEMGSLQYLSGSHREPPLGKGFPTANGARDVYPWLWERYEISPAHHLQPGDALAHNCLTLHFSEANRTDRDRWAWASQRFAGNACYNGLANHRSDHLGLALDQPPEHPLFPIVVE